MEHNKKQQSLKELYGENYYCSICHMYFQDMSGLGRHYHSNKHIKNKDQNPTHVELTMETINFIPFTCEWGVELTYENRVKHRKGKIHKKNMEFVDKEFVEEVKQPLLEDLEVVKIVDTPYMECVKISIKDKPVKVVEEKEIIPKGKVKCECGTLITKKCHNRHLSTKKHRHLICKNIVYDIIDNL